MAIASAVFVVLQAVGFTTEIPYLKEITTAFLGFLAVSGLIVKPPSKQEQESEDDAGKIQAQTSTTAQPYESGELTDIIDKIIDNNK